MKYRFLRTVSIVAVVLILGAGSASAANIIIVNNDTDNPDKSVVLFGGEDATGRSAETWEYRSPGIGAAATFGAGCAGCGTGFDCR